MSEYITPNVYINEYDKLTWVQPGATTTTGVVGSAEKGPSTEIVLITSYSEFTDTYGSGKGYLDFFARFFFKLGGKRLKVARATENYRYAGLEIATESIGGLDMGNDSTKSEYVIGSEDIVSSTGNITTFSSLLDEVPSIKTSSLAVSWTGKTLGTKTIDSDNADPWVYNTSYVMEYVVTNVAATHDFEVTTAGDSSLVNQEPNWDTTTGHKTGGTPSVWTNGHVYAKGDEVIAVGGAHSTLRFICTTAGTSGATEPTWVTTTPGTSTTSDNTVTWTVDNRSTLEFTCLGTKGKERLTLTEDWDYAGSGAVLVLAAANPSVATQVAGTVSEDTSASPPTFTVYIDDTITSDWLASTITSVSTILNCSVTTSLTGTYWYSTGSNACTGGVDAVSRSTSDNGSGALTAAHELTSGTINYTTGAISMTFSNPPVANTYITAAYTQQYTGIRKEDTEIKLLHSGSGLAYADWPEAGIIKIEDEYIRYSGKSVTAATAVVNEKVTLSNCTRGIYSSTAANHYTNGTDVNLVSSITTGLIDASGSGGNVPQGLSFITFKNLEEGILPSTGSIKVATSTANVVDTISYTSVTYSDDAKTAGYITLSTPWTLDPLAWSPIIVTSTYIPGDTRFVLAEDTIGGFSGKNFDKYQEYDGWGQATYINGVKVDDGGVEDPSEANIFFNILARTPGDWSNDTVLVSVYNYNSWRSTTNVPYYYNKIDKFPTTSDEVLIVIEDTARTEIEEYYLASLNPNAVDEWGKVKFITDVVNEYSNYIRIFINSSYRSQTTYLPNSVERVALTGGTDGTSGYVSDGNIILAYDLFLNKIDEELDLLSAAGYTSRPIQNNIIAICESRRDCFGILNIPYGFSVTDAVAFKESLTASTYVGLYYNWFKYYDPVTNAYLYLPPAIQVTGIFVKNDYLGESWSAPAGYNRANLIEVDELENKLDEGDMDTLYMNSINPIVNFNNGPVVWGIKTLSSAQSAFSKINIRRLLLTMEKDIGNSMKAFMFEPNTETTRTRVKLTIDPYMELVKGKEGIIDSLVVCDDTNNPYDKQVLGQLIVDLYIQPVFAAEYIILNFTVTKDVITSSVNG